MKIIRFQMKKNKIKIYQNIHKFFKVKIKNLQMLTANYHCIFFQNKINAELCIKNYKRCYRIFKNKLFERIIILTIILSSFKLVLDTYINSSTNLYLANVLIY